MRVLSQAEIDAMLAELLANPSVLPDAPTQDKPKEEEKPQENNN